MTSLIFGTLLVLILAPVGFLILHWVTEFGVTPDKGLVSQCGESKTKTAMMQKHQRGKEF